MNHHHAENPQTPQDFADTRPIEGDVLEFQYQGKTLVGSVQRNLGVYSLILASDGEAYLKDTKKETIKHLTDHDLCVHCGHYICGPDCPNRNDQRQEHMSDRQPVPLSEIVAQEPDTWINSPFEAVVSGAKLAQKGPNSATLSQMSNPQVKILGKFWDIDPSQFEGKLVRFSGQGMKRGAYTNKFKKTTQEVSIGDKATIEIIGVSAHSDKPLQNFAPSTPDNGRDAPNRQEMGNAGVPEESDEPLEDRVDAWFRAFVVVCLAADKDPAEMRAGLSPSDLKEITTGQIMSFKAAYGMHARPHFRKAGTTKRELDSMPEKSWQAEPAVVSWKDQLHPKTGVKLSALDMDTQLKLARWALTNEKVADRVFHAAVLMMAGAGRFGTPKACLSTSILSDPRYNNGFTDKDVDEYLEIRLGGSLKHADDVEVLHMLAEFDKVMEELVSKATDVIPF